MNFDDVHFSLGFVQWLILIIVGVYSWWVGKQSATNLEVAQLRERIVEIETQLKNMPSQAAVSEMNARLERIAANTEAYKEAQEAMRQEVHRLTDFLLNNR